MSHSADTVFPTLLKTKCMFIFRPKVVENIFSFLISLTLCSLLSNPGIGASEALKKALRDVMAMCDHVKDTFEESENDYYAAGGTGH